MLSLKKGIYLQQFAHYAWIHMIILVTTVPRWGGAAGVQEGGA